MDEIISQARREKLKELFRQLDKGKSIKELKEEFAPLLKEISVEDIARVEEELIKEGRPREKIQEVCDLHLALVKESIEEKRGIPVEHPIGILFVEHRMMLHMAERLKNLVAEIKGEVGDRQLKEWGHIAHHFWDILVKSLPIKPLTFSSFSNIPQSFLMPL